jgi:ABC-type nitrate/sulfonate/bicarbonate transport system substrate-binding protein
MFRKRFTWLLIFLQVVSLLLQSCASGQQEALPDLGTIQIGYLPTLGYSAFFLAEEKGYFKEQGLDVELTMFKSGSEMIVPLSTGQLDVGAGEPGTALFNAAAQDLISRWWFFCTGSPPWQLPPALSQRPVEQVRQRNQMIPQAGR